MHTNVISRRTLTVTTSAEADFQIRGVVAALKSQIGAEVTVSLGTQGGQFILVIDSVGTDDIETIMDIACDLRDELGGDTTIKLVDTYGETVLDDEQD